MPNKKLLTYFLCLLLFSCQSVNYDDNLQIYKKDIEEYNCNTLKEELIFLNKNIDNLNQYSKKTSLISHIMESFMSLGIFSGESYRKVNKSKRIFVEKKKITLKEQKLKNCK